LRTEGCVRYNIQNFDLPYLINRAEKLKVRLMPQVKDFCFLGRLKASKLRMRDATFSSKAYGVS
jgi:DNA polymerase delta subunit 1